MRQYIELENLHHSLRGTEAFERFSQDVYSRHAQIAKITFPDESHYRVPVETIAVCLVVLLNNLTRHWSEQVPSRPADNVEVSRAAADGYMAVLRALTGGGVL